MLPLFLCHYDMPQRKKTEMVWACDEKRWKLCWKESDRDGSSREQKERVAKLLMERQTESRYA